MNNEIKAGEYVRTYDGNFGKIRAIIGNRVFMNNDSYYYPINKIKKHSDDPADLVEVYDYVNGMLVVNVVILDKNTNENNDCVPSRIILCNRDTKCGLPPIKIYPGGVNSVVTREQFENIRYIINAK